MDDRKESETDSTGSSKGEEYERQDVSSDSMVESDHLMDSLFQAHRHLSFGPMSIVGEGKGASAEGTSDSPGGKVLEQLFRSARENQQQQKKRRRRKKGGKPEPSLPPDIPTGVLPVVSSSAVATGAQQMTPGVPKPSSLLASGGMTVQELEEMQHHPHRFKDEGASKQPPQPTPPPQQEDSTGEQKEPAMEDSSPGTHHFVPIQPSGSSTQGSSPSRSAENSPGGPPLILMTPSDFERRSCPASRERDVTSRRDMFLTPQAFSSPLHSTSSAPNLSCLLYEGQRSSRWRESEYASFLSSPPLEVQPLTRSQLQQAFIHMIRSDAEFLDKLYDAYITSFRSKKNATSKR